MIGKIHFKVTISTNGTKKKQVFSNGESFSALNSSKACAMLLLLPNMKYVKEARLLNSLVITNKDSADSCLRILLLNHTKKKAVCMGKHNKLV